jgi:hypothetical protein
MYGSPEKFASVPVWQFVFAGKGVWQRPLVDPIYCTVGARFDSGMCRGCKMINWNQRQTWIGVFDILGFKQLISQAGDELTRALLTNKVAELIQVLQSDVATQGKIEYLIFSDTFVILTQDSKPESYPWFLRLCKNLIDRSITLELPIRGAISVGEVFVSMAPPILIGNAFVEAYEFSEDQKWIGLILTPSASKALQRISLNPVHHDFVSDSQIPLCHKSTEDVFAYRFQNGSANFESPHLSHLAQMRHKTTKWKDKEKYDRTITFIKNHYRLIERKSVEILEGK